MKFILTHLGKNGERLGHMTELRSVPDLILRTPLCLTSTRGGAIPNLTRETLSVLHPEDHVPVLVPFSYHATQTDVLKEFGKGISEFMGLAGHPTIVVPQDPSEPARLGHHTNKFISVWHGGNRESITPSRYMEAVKVIQPDLVISLCDGETPKGCPNKRVQKAVTKTLSFLDECLLYKEDEDDAFKGVSFFGAIEGGYDLKLRTQSAEQTAKKAVDGFLLDGFHSNGPESRDVCMVEVSPILKSVMPLLPSDKPRAYFGSCDPATVCKLVRSGVDIFDTTFAYHATERGEALVFHNSLGDLEGLGESLNGDAGDNVQEGRGFLDLRDEGFKEDFSPILESCTCYTCRKHTRGYINHLLLTKELLAQVLLMIHNLHHYELFFKNLRNAIENDSVDAFTERIGVIGF